MMASNNQNNNLAVKEREIIGIKAADEELSPPGGDPEADDPLISSNINNDRQLSRSAISLDNSYVIPPPIIAHGPCPKCNRYAFGIYCLLLIVWLGLGSITFNFLEYDAEQARKAQPVLVLENVTFDNIADLNYFTTNPEARRLQIVNITIDIGHRNRQFLTIFYHRKLDLPKPPQKKKLGNNNKWDLAGSLFFCVALLATVGYGAKLAPVTPLGQLACLIFVSVGMPLFIAVAAELRRQLVRLCQTIMRISSQRRNGSPRQQRDDFAMSTLAVIFAVSLVCSLVFIIGPSVVFWYMEPDWTLTTALYFSFISLTTIGFGDFVAGGYGEPLSLPFCCATCLYRICLSFWLFFGLIFVATLFGTVHEFLSQKMTGGRFCPHRQQNNEHQQQPTTSPNSSLLLVINQKL